MQDLISSSSTNIKVQDGAFEVKLSPHLSVDWSRRIYKAPWLHCSSRSQYYMLFSIDLQVQKASGAYMLSARKQGLGWSASKPPGASTDPPSPLPFPDFSRMSNGSDVAASDDAESSLAEDEEFATEEHAHRWDPFSSGMPIVLAIAWQWASE